MPIYHKTPPSSTVGNHNTAEIDYHTSEAAKVKRTREQAYFNSYDFDAIEVLPYDDEEADDDDEDDDDDGGGGGGQSHGNTNQREREQRQLKSIETQIRKQQQQQQQQQFKPQQNSQNSHNSFMIDNRQHLQHRHHTQHHANSKNKPASYLQCISSIFSTKANTGNKPQQQKQQQPHHNPLNVAGCASSGVGNKDTAVTPVVPIGIGINTLSHDNKHLKLSSSETSTTSLSSSSIAQEILNVDNDVGAGGGVASDVIATVGNVGLLPLECTRDVTGSGARTSDPTTINIKNAVLVTCPSATTTATSANSAKTAGNGGNFLLPRAMLKYQSSTLSTPQGATNTQAGITNSMPLATNTNTNTNNSSSSNSKQHQQQQIILNAARDVHKLDGVKGGSVMMPTNTSNAALRLKKTSSSSSVITSLASEDVEEDRDLDEENRKELKGKLKPEEKVLAKTVKKKTPVRASSHQSHYSTDKSASSGYYSSNVCSTYSLEEHIYSEPTLDVRKLRHNEKENQPAANTLAAANTTTTTTSTANTLQHNNKLQQQHQQQQQQLQLSHSLIATAHETNSSVMRSLDIKRRYRYKEHDLQTLSSNRNSQEFNENLKILESSIENLDRHLKSFPAINPQEALVNFAQISYNPYASVNNNHDKLRPSSSYQQLPTIQETLDVVKKHSWHEDRSDDSLMDIDLDSFLLDKDKKLSAKRKAPLNKKGVDNPTFLTEEQEENHYKCAKYINSCPEDAYRVESDIIPPAHSSISGQSLAVSVDLYPKRYEEQLHFQNTRELLEDVRDKIRLLTQSKESDSPQMQVSGGEEEDDKEMCIPKELHSMINTLKHELELYLDRMNQHSELEIRQLCTGLVKNQHIVKMKNAFERRRSLTEANDIYSTYEAVQDGIVTTSQGMPISVRQQITSIRCSSDPNFKMKRKSLTEVFPMAECYVESLHTASTQHKTTSQLHRNLSYHKPVLEQIKSTNTAIKSKGSNSSSGSGNANTSETNDKESILDWHRKKPSIWEMYYGTNRIQQSLLGGKKNGLMVTTASCSSPSTMCYPSSRPESDFTLDLPRAEQLRIKMEKEKKFRQRCRVITTFLSLVFFLLTVMVVSLVLTRGKRMFGSMI